MVARLAAHLRPGGYLIVGHSESMAGVGVAGLDQMSPTVFSKLRDSGGECVETDPRPHRRRLGLRPPDPVRHLETAPDIEILGTRPIRSFAARRIQEEIPDVIILDLEMPRMDGLTFCARSWRRSRSR